MQYNKVLNEDTDKSGEYLMVVDNSPMTFTHEVYYYTITQNRISKRMTSNVDLRSAKGETIMSLWWYPHQNIVLVKYLFPLSHVHLARLTYGSCIIPKSSYTLKEIKLKRTQNGKWGKFRITHHADERKSNRFAALT